MTLFPTNATSADQKNRQTVGDPGNYPLGSSDWYFDAVARGQWERIRAQGFAEGMEAAAKIADVRAHDYARQANEHEGTRRGVMNTDKAGASSRIAATIREAAKTKGP